MSDKENEIMQFDLLHTKKSKPLKTTFSSFDAKAYQFTLIVFLFIHL